MLFPQVIIDNMMNLEVSYLRLLPRDLTNVCDLKVLFAAADINGNQTYRDIAITHADTTIKNHFRPDCKDLIFSTTNLL